VDRRISHDAAGFDLPGERLELGLHQKDELAVLCGDLCQCGKSECEGDEGEVRNDQGRSEGQRVPAELPDVRALKDRDAGVLPEPEVQLTVADIDRDHGVRAGREEAVGEASGGGSGIEAGSAGGIDHEALERGRELLAAARDEPPLRRGEGHRILGTDQGGVLQRRPAGHPDAARRDDLTRGIPAAGQSPAYELLIERSSHGLPSADASECPGYRPGRRPSEPTGVWTGNVAPGGKLRVRVPAMIPLRDANPTSRFAFVTFAIILVNVAVFLLWQPTFGTQEQQQVFFFCHAEIPWEVSHQASLADGGAPAAAEIGRQLGANGVALQQFLQSRCPGKSWWESVFVAMFLHAGWLHIGGNMLFLWIFGNNVEDRVGKVAYLLLYFAGGIAATALQLLAAPNSVIPNLGASGAIAAILGAYIVMFPRARVLTLVIFFFITAVELPAALVLGVWFVLQFFSGVGSLGRHVNGGVAYWAHVGGFLLGATVAFLFYRSRGGIPPPAARPRLSPW
jgi:membrane associated rhomboid family serine protease